MEVAGSPSVCGSQCAYDCLVPDDYVNMVVFPENIELGDPTVVAPPVVGAATATGVKTRLWCLCE